MFNLYQHVLVRLPTAPAETKPLLLEDNLAHWAQQQDNKGHAWNMPGTKPISCWQELLRGFYLDSAAMPMVKFIELAEPERQSEVDEEWFDSGFVCVCVCFFFCVFLLYFLLFGWQILVGTSDAKSYVRKAFERTLAR